MTRHGLAQRGKRDKLYSIWVSMRQRCENENCTVFHHYGGRGIKVCDRWSDVNTFMDDMRPTWSPGLSLERVDNNGNYEPGNCCWIPRSEQCKNRRSNVLLNIDGRTETLAQWARISGVKRETIVIRLKWGWNPKQAVFQKAKVYARRVSNFVAKRIL